MQGDLIEACPVAVFKDDLAFSEEHELEALLGTLTTGVGIQTVRSIVMTQACDLAEKKVRNAILCPAHTLDDFRSDWEAHWTTTRGKPPTEGDWRSHINAIKAGRIWNFAL